MLSLGWLLILGAVAAALVVAGPARRIVSAVGTGLVAGQLALLAGVAYGIAHTTITTTYRGTYFSRTTPVVIEAGVYAAFAAAAVLGLALLLAHGVPRRIRDAETEAAAPEAGPADLTVTAGPDPATLHGTDPEADVWRRGGDIDVSGGYLDR